MRGERVGGVCVRSKSRKQRRFNYIVQEGAGGLLGKGTFGPVFKCLNVDT
jgi:hypothetical protein